MTKTIAKAMVAMALLAGCGDISLTGVNDGPAATGGDDAVSAAQGLTVDLRMKAKGAENFQAILLQAKDVQVRVNGVGMPVEMTGRMMDLAQMTQAWKLASFTVPETAGSVEITIELNDVGGYEASDGTGALELRNTVLRFESTVANLLSNNKAVVELDASKAFFAKDGETRVLVPKFKVAY